MVLTTHQPTIIKNITIYVQSIRLMKQGTYHKITNDDCCQEKRYTRYVSNQHTVPHTFYPFSAQHSEYNHETVHEVCEVPSWEVSVVEAVHVICTHMKIR